MADEQDPHDLVALFGLSNEEALGLGLSPALPQDGASDQFPESSWPDGEMIDPALFGLTQEELALLGPEMLRELRLAMHAQEAEVSSVPATEIGTAAEATRSPDLVPDPPIPLAPPFAGQFVPEMRPPAAAPPSMARESWPVPPEAAPRTTASEVVPQPSALESFLRKLSLDSPPATPSDRADAGPPSRFSAPDPLDVAPAAPVAPPPPGAPQRQQSIPEGGTYPVAGPDPAPAGVDPAGQSPFLKELFGVFTEESLEMLDGFHASLETLERAFSEPALAEARRTVHTIKGGARMCGLRGLTDLSHACEDLLGPSLSGGREVASRTIALLFQAEQEMRAALSRPERGPGSDASLREMVARLGGADAPPVTPGRSEPAEAVARSSAPAEHLPSREGVAPATTPSSPAASPPASSGRLLDRASLLRRPTITTVSPQGTRLAVDLHKVEGMVAKVTEIVANRATSHTLMHGLGATVLDVLRTVHRLQGIAVQLQYQIVAAGLDVTADNDSDGLALETYGPIKQSLLQLHEAIADQQVLVQQTIDTVNNRQALAATETRLDTDLQSALLNMRLLPISQLRVRLDQVVRSAAASAGREVRWAMEGQQVALDKHVCDRLFEPLMHLLRNAIDHGIEPPDERVANGKPRTGRIVVQALVEGNQAVVAVSDDGRGIDPDRIAAVAASRGLLTEAQAQALSTPEKLELIFRPGFSTASTVTDLSGRGVGMEIVRETCTRMGGTVTVGPRPGGGTVFTLHVPLSLSVVHALIVHDAGRTFCIPASQVVSVHLVRPVAVFSRDEGQFVRIGRDELPLYHLPPPAVRVRGVLPKPALELSVLIVPFHSGRVALVVEDLVNEEDLIVKPLPLLLQGVDRLLGAVVLSTGEAVPVLNVPPLLDGLIAGGRAPLEALAPPPLEQIVLVVDDSLTMRVALTQTLANAGYTVLAARDGQEALELIRTRGLPCLVTLDIEMPRMDGLETLYAIRHLPGGEGIPIFMLTSRSGHKHKRTALQFGATRYFTKPYHAREFLRAVQEATGAPLRSTG